MKAFYLITLVVACLTRSQSQQLIVEYSSAKLPTGLDAHRLYYDGLDSIYIFGGNVSPYNQILKYSLESDTISEIGRLPIDIFYVSIQSDSDGKFFIFGAGASKNEVFKYDLTLNTAELVATLPWDVTNCLYIKSCNLSQSQNTVFIFGANSVDQYNKILMFDLENYSITQSAETIPEGLDYNYGGSICVNGRAFIFPNYISNRSVWEFDFNSHLLSRVGQSDIPNLNFNPTLVAVEGLIFIITGFLQNPIPREEFSQEGILRFDPASNSTDFLRVDNWPVKDGESYFVIDPQCEYVQKLGRIYCFGGFTLNLVESSEGFSDEIFFIEMPYQSTTTIEIESTTKAPNLEVQYLTAKLPSVEYCHRLYYDGDDSVYIFGGCLNTNQILKYSIESDSLSQIGTLPTNFARGSIQKNEDGNVLLFGSGFGADVLKYDVSNNVATNVATLAWSISNSPTILSCNSILASFIYIFGVDSEKSLQALNTENYNVEFSTPLEVDPLYGSAICVGDRIFVFPTSTRNNRNVYEFDTVTNKLIPLGHSDLLTVSSYPSVVSDGNFAFIITGFDRNQDSSHEGILHFDPTSGSINFLPVNNWPVKDGETSFGPPPQCVFIQKSSRIYCFGGQSLKKDGSVDRQHDEIFYIDMSS